MRPRPSERGAALLTVLLLVAVMATVSATALDRISLATRLAGNAAMAGQGRAWLGMAEQLTAVRLEDMLAADKARTTLAGNWLGTPRSIALPDGAQVTAEVTDAGNCFNLNSLASAGLEGGLFTRPSAVNQFTALMTMLGIDAGTATQISSSAADWIDTDSTPLPAGNESGSVPPANRQMAHEGELNSVAGMTPQIAAILRPWVCALPSDVPTPINVNTLLPEQAPLLAMLAPGQLDVERARAVTAQRPANGFQSAVEFWKSPGFRGMVIPPDSADQVKVRSSWFRLQARVAAEGQAIGQTSLLAERNGKVDVVRREWSMGE